MEKLVDVLKVGEKTNSLGRANEAIDAVLADKSMLDELYECLFADDAWVRMRAADSLEKICRAHPDWIEPYVDKMVKDLTASKQPSIQWHLVQIFAAVNMTKDQQKQIIPWMKGLLSTTDVDWIVSVTTMKALVQFYSQGLIGKNELVPLFERQQQHTSKTVRKKALQFLQDL